MARRGGRLARLSAVRRARTERVRVAYITWTIHHTRVSIILRRYIHYVTLKGTPISTGHIYMKITYLPLCGAILSSRRSTPSSSPRAPTMAPPATVLECFPLTRAACAVHPRVSSRRAISIGQPCRDRVASRSQRVRIASGTARTGDPSHASERKFSHDPSSAGRTNVVAEVDGALSETSSASSFEQWPIALGSVALGYAAGTRHEHSRRSRYMPL